MEYVEHYTVSYGKRALHDFGSSRCVLVCRSCYESKFIRKAVFAQASEFDMKSLIIPLDIKGVLAEIPQTPAMLSITPSNDHSLNLYPQLAGSPSPSTPLIQGPQL